MEGGGYSFIPRTTFPTRPDPTRLSPMRIIHFLPATFIHPALSPLSLPLYCFLGWEEWQGQDLVKAASKIKVSLGASPPQKKLFFFFNRGRLLVRQIGILSGFDKTLLACFLGCILLEGSKSEPDKNFFGWGGENPGRFFFFLGWRRGAKESPNCGQKDCSIWKMEGEKGKKKIPSFSQKIRIQRGEEKWLLSIVKNWVNLTNDACKRFFLTKKISPSFLGGETNVRHSHSRLMHFFFCCCCSPFSFSQIMQQPNFFLFIQS